MFSWRFSWIINKNVNGKALKCRCEDLYLFGFIKLYSRQVEYPTEV